MYIYLVHGIFCRGEYNIYGKTNLFIATVVFIVATTVCAKILWLATDGTNKLLDKAFQNLRMLNLDFLKELIKRLSL